LRALGRLPDEAFIRLVVSQLREREAFYRVRPAVQTLLQTSLVAERLVDEIAGASPRVARSAVEEPELLADEQMKALRIEGEVRRAIFEEEALDAAAVSKLLRSRSVNPRQYATALRARGSIIGLPERNRYLYPAFQFDRRRHRVHPEVAEVNGILGAARDPWGVASWWLIPHGYLAGRKPGDLVGTSEAHVLPELARAVVEPVG
jgi:hypothetical protein